MEKEKGKIKNIGKFILKLILMVMALFISYILAIYLLLILGSMDINIVLIVWSALLLPIFSLIAIYSKNKKRDYKRFGICILLFCYCFKFV